MNGKGRVEMSDEAALLRRIVRRRGEGLGPVAVQENEGKFFCIFFLLKIFIFKWKGFDTLNVYLVV